MRVNPSTALGTVLVDELVRGGVRHVVLCPGSRSAPLAYALLDADTADRLTLDPAALVELAAPADRQRWWRERFARCFALLERTRSTTPS